MTIIMILIMLHIAYDPHGPGQGGQSEGDKWYTPNLPTNIVPTKIA